MSRRTRASRHNRTHHEKLTPEKSSRHSKILCFAAAVIGLCGISAASYEIGAHQTAKDIQQQQEWNAKRAASRQELAKINKNMHPVSYTSGGERVQGDVTIIASYPDRPIEPMIQEREEKKEKSELSFLGALVAAFGVGGERLARIKQTQTFAKVNTTRPPTPETSGQYPGAQVTKYMPISLIQPTPTDERVDTTSALNLINSFQHTTPLGTFEYVDHEEPVPPTEQIDPAYVRKFEPTLYTSETYESEVASLFQMMEPEQPKGLEAGWQRLQTARQAQRESLQQQTYDPFDTGNKGFVMPSLLEMDYAAA